MSKRISSELEDVGPGKRIRGGGVEDYEPTAEDEVMDDEVDYDEAAMEANMAAMAQNGEASVDSTVKQRWGRPDVKPFDPNEEDINVQWLDMDMVSGPPLSANPKKGSAVLGSSIGPVPVIRVFGCSDKGHSASIFIHGFTPYALFAAPKEFENTSSNLERLREYIDNRLSQQVRDARNYKVFCHGVKFLDDRKSIMGYSTTHTQFFQVYCSMPSMVPPLKRIFSEGVKLPGMVETVSCQPFESNVPFVLRFMIDQEISGAGWLSLPKGAYSVRKESEKKTHCQLEIDISYKEIISRESVGEWSKIAPLRVLSFDIECQGRKGYFPEAEKDPVIQIANCVSVYGTPDPVVKNVFTLKGCLPIVGTQVITSETEQELLLKWQQFLQAADVDIITGYNVQNFDIPYLLDRAEALSKVRPGPNMSPFKLWGRIKGSPAKMKDTMFQSAAYGKRNNVETTIEGRVVFDMLPYMQRNHKLSSYTLNSVCAEFLGQQKEDVHHSIISDLQNGNDEDRHRLAVYCVKDALLPQRLMDKLSVLINYVEMARVTGVPVSFLISRGQQIKVFSMILRKCRNEKLCVPDLPKGRINGDGVAYEGATVLDPIKKYYEVPIATLDFASLYPSIMQAYNLCYTTLASPQDIANLDPEDLNKNVNGTFVKASKKKGILPTILSELLSARKQAKKDMKNAPNEFEKAVQNGRQLALKVSANSVYGFTGAAVGQLPCMAIASTVTNYGRQLLEKTKACVEETYTKANGYEYDSQVVYGDTDSVMVKFGNPMGPRVFELSEEAAEKCSKLFPHPILLEFEKVYYPYLLMNKKRYAGLLWTNVEKFDYMDCKGLETVRRDNCQLVRDVIQTSLNKILIDRDTKSAIAYVKKQIADLLQNKMDISRLVITKSLNKGAEWALGLGGKAEDYKIKQAHVELAARMKKRDAGSAPQMGDRVPYVIIQGPKGAQTYTKAEDPIYVLDNNVPIDCQWYLSNQLTKPLTRIFEPVVNDVQKDLLKGDHTRKIFIATPTAKKGSLMSFAVKKATCMGCKALIPKEAGNLCEHCVCKENEIYLDKLKNLRVAEGEYSKLWSAAQRIHGQMFQDVMCTGDGCACQFYRRKKVQQDIKRCQIALDQFSQ